MLFSPKRNIPKINAQTNQSAVFILCALSLLFFVLANYIPSKQEGRIRREMKEASEIMAEAMGAIKKCREERSVPLDVKNDFNETGLIGVELSSITTSLGNLEAKRTTTNPNFAALVVFLLKQAGLERGDTVAVGASGSFPALIVAALSASRAMGLFPVLICSLGASQWGANIPSFHWLHMQSCLQRASLFDTLPVAISMGGEKDSGMDMTAEGQALLLNDAEKSDIFFLNEPDLERNVRERMRIYEENGGERGIRAFINIGGSWSNMGEDSEVLKLKPGLVYSRSISSAEKRGVIHEMALREIPLIHLLYIKGLAKRFRLPWDPFPLSHPGEGKIYTLVRETQVSFYLIACVYFLLVILVFIFRNRLALFFRSSYIQ